MTNSVNNTQRALCQCPNNQNGEEPCTKYATTNSLFCEQHQSCAAAPTNGSEPKYIPEILNKSFAYKETNNCLSYAIRGNNINKELVAQCKSESDCNVNFEQPGAASGQRGAMRKEGLRTCPVVKKLVKSDLGEDFKPSTFYEPCPKGFSKVALVVDKGTDYHWYRQNPKKKVKINGEWKYIGMWSHKDGSNPVKDFDAKKRPIFNPKQASRDYGSELNYEDFCGFFCVNRTKRMHLKQGGKRKSKGKTRSLVLGGKRNTRKNKLNRATRKRNRRLNVPSDL